MKKFRAVFFDFDDTLGNREQYTYDAFAEKLDSVAPGLDPLKREEVLQWLMIFDQHGEGDRSVVRRRLLDQFHIDFGEDFRQWWIDHQWTHAVLFDDAMPLLKNLKEQGYLLGIITNGTSAAQDRKVDKTGLRDLADTAVVSETAGYWKPDPRIFAYAAKQLNVQPQDCLMIGDIFGRDIVGAMRAGMSAVWHWPHGFRPHDPSVIQIHRLSELPSAMEKLERER